MKAVIIYGPPCSGKGTQAKLLAERLSFFHLDTGALLRDLFYNSSQNKDVRLQHEKKLNEEGKLQTPFFVLPIVKNNIKKAIRLGQSVVLSGSPRTLYEAFGDKKHEGIITLLEKYYGKKNIFIFIIQISKREVIKRGLQRTICSVCRVSLLGSLKNNQKKCFKTCPFCGGKIIHRFDDNKKVINIRLAEYHQKTESIFKELMKRKYKIFFIKGNFLPYRIHSLIVSKIMNI
jgi:adenylate kinase